MWRAGRLTEKYVNAPGRLTDLGLRHIAIARLESGHPTRWLARTVMGKSVAELEAEGIGRNRLRFVRGDRQPRVLDGVVHAWLDDDDRVIRTRHG